MKKTSDIFLTPTQAARVLNISLSTLKKFIYSGRIKTLKTPGGHHRIRRSDLLQMVRAGSTGPQKPEEVVELARELLARLEEAKRP